jgi:hypothetical protein
MLFLLKFTPETFNGKTPRQDPALPIAQTSVPDLPELVSGEDTGKEFLSINLQAESPLFQLPAAVGIMFSTPA